MSTHDIDQISSTQFITPEAKGAEPAAHRGGDAQDAMLRVESDGVTRLSFFGCSIEIGDVAGMPLAAILGC
jgi:hypothetical protein